MASSLAPRQEGFSRFEESLFITGAVLLLIVGVHVLNVTNVISTREWGIYPREEWGMRGVFLGPFVHSGIRHLLSNAGPMVITLFSLLYFYPKVAMRSLIMIWFFTGIAVWCLANKAWHVGASGVVYGLVSFIFWTGVFRKNKKSIGLAVIMMILYSGMFQGIFPNDPTVSWESHLYGSLVGIFTAWWFKTEIEEDEIETRIVFEPSIKTFFLARDTFEKTKAQRQAEEEERLRQSLLEQGYPPFWS